jgi:hypothetical protein
MQQAMETGTAYHTRLDPPPANGWIPPEVSDMAAGGQGNGVAEGVANSSADFQQHAAISEIQPKLHFVSEDCRLCHDTGSR